ncbi:DUF1783-domain-containing protein [Mytilinidion resinicola]|uniref:DUF1783-domain-containing protein n=1 Tax=Mytilinidion resinicola TaxID=574789 RepID=A0A6A6YLY6_9PEZI|nr:DUF1783-domain-containing protein [Mytilinidion resinicola]KAF2809548.1 DUF1783-domain-containing protein [Mytilinidion resinicola]
MPPRIPLPRPARVPLRTVPKTARRTLIAAPKATSGPLLERRADRALPTLPTRWGWLRTLPIFAVIVGGSCLAIFNYQKQSSSVTTSTLYALRTNAEAREILGDEIYFRDRIPWISGELNQLHGRIDISFGVKGTKQGAVMRFRSERRGRMGFFETLEWSLTTEDGQVIQLYKPEGPDPFKKITSRDDEDKYTH